MKHHVLGRRTGQRNVEDGERNMGFGLRDHVDEVSTILLKKRLSVKPFMNPSES